MATIRVDCCDSFWIDGTTPNTGHYDDIDYLRLFREVEETELFVKFPIDGIASFSHCSMHLVLTGTNESCADQGFSVKLWQVTSNWSEQFPTGGYGTAGITGTVYTYRDQWYTSTFESTNESNPNRFRIDDFVWAAKARGEKFVSVNILCNTSTFGHYYDFGAARTAFKPYIIFYGATAAESSYVPVEPVYPRYTTVFQYPDKTIPAIPAGNTRIHANADTYLDYTVRYPPASAGLSSYIITQGGIRGKKSAYLNFPLTGITTVRTAKLKMYCPDYRMDGSYLPLVLEMRYGGWSEDQDAKHIRAVTKTLFNKIYADATVVDETVEIDVTSFVQTALGMGLTNLSFSIDVNEIPRKVAGNVVRASTDEHMSEHRNEYVAFASRNTNVSFKPIIDIDPDIPALTTVLISADGDCYTDPDRPVQTHGDLLHIPPILPVINHELAEYPISTDENELRQIMWIHFPLDDLDGSIEEAKLHFTVTENSYWNVNYSNYLLIIDGRNISFDQETFNYSSTYGEDQIPNIYCTLLRSEYEGQRKDVVCDITPLAHYYLRDGGLLVSIKGQTNKSNIICVAGNESSDYPYLELKIRSYDHPSEVVNTTTRRAIIYPETDSANSEVDSIIDSSYASYNAEFNLAAIDLPDDVFDRMDTCVYHLPVIGLYPEDGGSLVRQYYDGICNYHYMTSPLFDYTYLIYNNVTVTTRPAYIEIELPWLKDKLVRDAIRNDDGKFVVHITLGNFADSNTNPEVQGNDGFRFGTKIGGYPAYLELRWKTTSQVKEYYVSVGSGSDSNDGMTLASSWQTFDYAVQHVPEGGTLFVDGLFGGNDVQLYTWFLNEPLNNHIAPTNNRVTIRPLYPACRSAEAQGTNDLQGYVVPIT